MNWRPPLVSGGADRTQNHPDTRGTHRVSIANFQTPHPTMPNPEGGRQDPSLAGHPEMISPIRAMDQPISDGRRWPPIIQFHA